MKNRTPGAVIYLPSEYVPPNLKGYDDMVDNTDEFAGNAHLRRAAQHVDAERCALCQLHEGQQVPTSDGVQTTVLVTANNEAGVPVRMCQWCLEIIVSARQTTRPVEISSVDGAVEFGDGDIL